MLCYNPLHSISSQSKKPFLPMMRLLFCVDIPITYNKYRGKSTLPLYLFLYFDDVRVKSKFCHFHHILILSSSRISSEDAPTMILRLPPATFHFESTPLLSVLSSAFISSVFASEFQFLHGALRPAAYLLNVQIHIIVFQAPSHMPVLCRR